MNWQVATCLVLVASAYASCNNCTTGEDGGALLQTKARVTKIELVQPSPLASQPRLPSQANPVSIANAVATPKPHTRCKETYEPFKSKIADALWTGELTVPARRIGKARRIGNISLVVAHCDKSMDWIWQTITRRWRIKDITIYTKCGHPVGNVPPNAKVVKLPNIGRNDHSFAYHMARLEASPSDLNDIVVFWKDNPYRLNDRHRGRSFFKMLQIASVNGFACGVLPQPVNPNGHRGSFPFPVFEPSIYHYHDLWRTFRLQEYVREPGRDAQGRFSSRYADLGQYVDSLNLSVSKPYVEVCYGGLFAATRAQILRQNRSVWSAMENSLSRASNVQEGHYAERCWGGLLAKPLSHKAIALLDKKHHCYFCREMYSMNRCGILGYFHNSSKTHDVR